MYQNAPEYLEETLQKMVEKGTLSQKMLDDIKKQQKKG